MISTMSNASPELPFPETPRVEPWIRALAELFRDEMAELHFPEVDATRLAALIERVDEHALAVAKARATLEAADRALTESHAELSRAARRAHGYATVFAQDHEDLSAQLAEMRPAAPKRRRSNGNGSGKRTAKAKRTSAEKPRASSTRTETPSAGDDGQSKAA